MSTANKPREAIREGAAEVKEKLKADLSQISRFTRVRRFVSLSPTMVCPDCEGARKVACSACGGEGKQKMVWNDEEAICEACKGAKELDCGACFGRARVKNIHRKKFVWLLALGFAAWGFVLYRIWGGDVLPEQRAKYLHGGGGGGKAMSQVPDRSRKRSGLIDPATGTPAAGQPGMGGTGQPPGDGAAPPPAGDNLQGGVTPNLGPRGGQMRPQGGALGGTQ